MIEKKELESRLSNRHYRDVKYKYLPPGFELISLCSLPMKITITARALLRGEISIYICL